MKRHLTRRPGLALACVLGGSVLLLWSTLARAQTGTRTGSTGGNLGGSSSGGGFGGSSGGSGNTSSFRPGSQSSTSSSSTNTTYTGPVSSDPFRSYYGNIYSMGLYQASSVAGSSSNSSTSGGLGGSSSSSSGSGFTGGSGGSGSSSSSGMNAGANKQTVSFGAPLYFNTTGTAGASATLSATNSQGMTFNTFNQRRTPSYVTVVGFDRVAPPPPPSQLQADLQGVLARSSRLTSAGNIRVSIEDGMVVLRGSVPTLRDRTLAENMLRMTPRTPPIRNELLVNGKPVQQ
jgi:hypothetical protein